MSLEEDTQYVEMLLRHFNAHERLIVRVFTLDPPVLRLIRRTIDQLARSLGHLPDWCTGDWVNRWKEKLAVYEARYEAAVKSQSQLENDDEEEDEVAEAVAAINAVHALPPNDNSRHRLRRRRGHRQRPSPSLSPVNTTNINMNEDSAFDGDVSGDDDSSVDLEESMSGLTIRSEAPRETIKSQLANVFDQLPRISKAADVDSLKQLLYFAVLCFKMASDHQVEFDLFSRSLHRLPGALRRAFEATQNCDTSISRRYFQFGAPLASVFALFAYMKETVRRGQARELEAIKVATAEAEAAREEEEVTAKKEGRPPPAKPWPGINPNQRQLERETFIQNRTLCFKCYNFGHQEEECTSNQMLPF